MNTKFLSQQAARHQLHMDVMACERLGTIRSTQWHSPDDLHELKARAKSVLEAVAFLQGPPEFKLYQGVARWEIRPYVTGEDIGDIVFNNDVILPTLEGGYIIRKQDYPKERWYITANEFAQKFERVPEMAKVREKLEEIATRHETDTPVTGALAREALELLR